MSPPCSPRSKECWTVLGWSNSWRELVADCSRVTSFHLRSDRPVARLEEKQWLPASDQRVFHFGNEDGVIAGILRGLQTAFQVGQRSMQHGCPMMRSVEPGAAF